MAISDTKTKFLHTFSKYALSLLVIFLTIPLYKTIVKAADCITLTDEICKSACGANDTEDTTATGCSGATPKCCKQSQYTCLRRSDYECIPTGTSCGVEVSGLTCASGTRCCQKSTSTGCTAAIASGCSSGVAWACPCLAAASLGCPANSRCVQNAAGMTGYCTTCTPGATNQCDAAHVGKCGIAGGCGEGSKCIAGYPSAICHADTTCTSDAGITTSPYSGPVIDFTDLLNRIYQVLYPIALIIGMGFIALAGYTLMTSEGNPTKVKEGQEQLTAAILGTFFVLGGLAGLRVLMKALLGISL